MSFGNCCGSAHGRHFGIFLAWMPAILLATAGAVSALDPVIEVHPRKITVGDPVELTLSVPVSSGGQVHFPVSENFPPAEVIRIDTLERGSRWTLRYVISLFEPGETDLPDLPVVVVSEGVADTLWVDPGRIEVASVVENLDTSTIRDIRPPVKLPWTFREMLPWIAGGLVGALLAMAAIFWWRKRRREEGIFTEYQPPPLPPDIIAMRRLEELRVRKWWQDGRSKEYHSELTDILKEYIGATCGFNALEMTSEDLIADRARWAHDDELFGHMRRILNMADLVKFAKLSPLPHDHERSLELAFTYIERTRPKREALIQEAA